MTAKSAPQLLRVAPEPTLAQHLRAGVLLVVLMLAMAGISQVLDYEERAVPVVRSQPQAEAPAAAQHAHPASAVAQPHTETVHENPRHRALSEFLAKRYNLSQAMTFDLVSIAHAAGQQVGLDPLLIIAVMAVESRFNRFAESVMGAKGLMQVIPKYHVDKFREIGGDKYAVFDPETNIFVGSQILKEYISRTGNLSTALQLYVGSSDDEDDSYIGKVMTEKQRLQQVVRKAVPARRNDNTRA